MPLFFDLETKAPAEGKVLMAERHQFKDGKISHVRSAFDGRPCAAMFTGLSKQIACPSVIRSMNRSCNSSAHENYARSALTTRAASTMAISAGRTSSHRRVLSPQSGLTQT
jgi:hypothetical protein